MNKAQFIAYLAPQFGDSKKEAARAVEVVFDAIVRNISKGEDVRHQLHQLRLLLRRLQRKFQRQRRLYAKLQRKQSVAVKPTL